MQFMKELIREEKISHANTLLLFAFINHDHCVHLIKMHPNLVNPKGDDLSHRMHTDIEPRNCK